MPGRRCPAPYGSPGEVGRSSSRARFGIGRCDSTAGPRPRRLQEHLVDFDLDGQAGRGNGALQRRGQLRIREERADPLREAIAGAPGDVNLRGLNRPMTQVPPLDLIGFVCADFLEGHRDASIIDQRLDKMARRSGRHEGRQRASGGVDLPPRHAVSVRHQTAVAGGREADAGPLLEKADDFRWNHDVELGGFSVFYPTLFWRASFAVIALWTNWAARLFVKSQKSRASEKP